MGALFDPPPLEGVVLKEFGLESPPLVPPSSSFLRYFGLYYQKNKFLEST